MAKPVYFLPCALKEALGHEKARLLKITETTATLDGFNIPGYTLAGSKRNMESFLSKATLSFGIHQILKAVGQQTLYPREEIRVGDEIVRAIGPDHIVMVPMNIGRSDWERLEPLADDLRGTLKWLSEHTGHEFLFDMRAGGFAPTYPRGRTMIHIVLGASAPGEVIDYRRKEVCGIQLELDGSTVEYPNGPSLGSGTIVKDENGESVAQVVGNTIFLLLPLDIQYARVLRGKDGLGLFKKVLRYAWNAYVAGPELPELTPIETGEQYSNLVTEWLGEFPGIRNRMIAHAEQEARELFQQYQSKLRYVRVLRAGLEDALNRQAAYDPIQGMTDWERLRAHPLLREFGLVQAGFQAVTKIIVYEHAGKRHRLGNYVIRVSMQGYVSVWAEKTLHPGGFPHPHIGWSGEPCFGNLSIAIAQAATEHRIADTVELVLRWLAEGYDPLLAETPIREWPEEKEDEHAET